MVEKVVVVAGEKGLTPRRIFCFKMKDFLWEKKGVRSKKLRQQVLEENLEIRRKSVIPGFCWMIYGLTQNIFLNVIV